MPSQRPTVRFLAHGGERSGPPIYLLRLFRWWATHQPDFDTELVVARPGNLVPQFRVLTRTSVARLDRRSPERVGERALRAIGMGGTGERLVRRAVCARVRSAEPDLTVVNGATSTTVELLAALAPTGPVVTIAHELSTGWFANLDPQARNLLLTRTSAFLAVSNAVREFLVGRLGVRPDAITVVAPPVDLAELDRVGRVLDAAGAPPLVAGSGVTDWRKAPELWLRVAALVRLHPGHEHVRFAWAGGESRESQSQAFWPLEHEMERLDLRENVEFLGTVEEPWRALRSAAVMVSTAKEDAYPLACAESIAAGVPVVGFDVDGVGEMVRASGCGVVVPYPDEAALAATVVRLLDDDTERVRMAELGRRFGSEILDVALVAPRVADWITEQAT